MTFALDVERKQLTLVTGDLCVRFEIMNEMLSYGVKIYRNGFMDNSCAFFLFAILSLLTNSPYHCYAWWRLGGKHSPTSCHFARNIRNVAYASHKRRLYELYRTVP